MRSAAAPRGTPTSTTRRTRTPPRPRGVAARHTAAAQTGRRARALGRVERGRHAPRSATRRRQRRRRARAAAPGRRGSRRRRTHRSARARVQHTRARAAVRGCMHLRTFGGDAEAPVTVAFGVRGGPSDQLADPLASDVGRRPSDRDLPATRQCDTTESSASARHGEQRLRERACMQQGYGRWVRNECKLHAAGTGARVPRRGVARLLHSGRGRQIVG